MPLLKNKCCDLENKLEPLLRLAVLGSICTFRLPTVRLG